MLNEPLNKVLGQASKVKILRFLIKTQAQLNGREIAKNIGLSHVKVHAALKDLARQGLINIRSVGKSLIYWLNEEHFLVKEILMPIFEKEAKILSYIVKTILNESNKPWPLSIILFGSFSKGEASADSDIDLVIIYPDNKSKSLIAKDLAKAEKKVTSLFGNRLACIPLKIREFQKKVKKNDRFIKEVLKTGRVIYGKSTMELMYHASKKV